MNVLCGEVIMSGKRVLLVDDDREFVAANRLVLESKGYEVSDAHDVDSAKKKALETGLDVIVLDVMMETNQAGFELARWLRSQETTSSIPIVMLTAINQRYPLNFDKDEIWLPVDEFFEKPVTPDDLLEAVSKAASKE